MCSEIFSIYNHIPTQHCIPKVGYYYFKNVRNAIEKASLINLLYAISNPTVEINAQVQ